MTISTIPSYLNVASCITPVSSHKISIITFIVKEVLAISTNLSACISRYWIKISTSTCKPNFYIAELIATIIILKVTIITWEILKINTIPTNLCTVASCIWTSIPTIPTINNSTISTAISCSNH